MNITYASQADYEYIVEQDRHIRPTLVASKIKRRKSISSGKTRQGLAG